MFRIIVSVIFAISLSLVSTAHISAAPQPVHGSDATMISFSVHSASAPADAHELVGGSTCTSPTLDLGGGHLSCHVDVGPVSVNANACGFEKLPRRNSERLGALCPYKTEPPLRPPQFS